MELLFDKEHIAHNTLIQIIVDLTIQMMKTIINQRAKTKKILMMMAEEVLKIATT